MNVRTDFHAGFTGHDNNRGIRCADCFLYFSYKIKKSRRIQQIDLYAFPFERNNGGGNRYLALLLLLAIITDGIAICYLTHA